MEPGTEVSLPYVREIKGVVLGDGGLGVDGTPRVLVRWHDVAAGKTVETRWHPAFLVPWAQDPALDPSPIEPPGSLAGCRRPVPVSARFLDAKVTKREISGMAIVSGDPGNTPRVFYKLPAGGGS